MGDAAARVLEGSFYQVLLLSLDIAGTFAFAVSGASAGVKRELDLFGVLLLSFAAAVAGGIARDMLIGAIPPAAVVVRRGERVESEHRVAYAVVDAAGRLLEAAGDVDRAVFPRSATKPLQALALVESGAADRFAVSPQELALACASHSGEPDQVALVRAWLARLGFDAGRP